MNEGRWMAEVFMNAKTEGPLPYETFTFEEFAELGEFIEQGPDWNTIHHITITLQRRS